MKKSLLVLAVLTAIIFVLSSCTGSASVPSQASQTASQASQAASSPASGDKVSVSIQNFSFSPGTVTIKAGTTVVWTNNDSAAHTIKADSFNSPSLAKGDTFEYKFDSPGTYNYICGIHTSMKGQVIVQ